MTTVSNQAVVSGLRRVFGQRSMHPLLRRALMGAIAGALATGPMTAVLEGPPGPGHRRAPIAPFQVVRRLRFRTGVTSGQSHLQGPLATVGHFGYGAFMGVLYALTAERVLRGARMSGPLYGLAVWAMGYLGWLPALRLYPAPQHDEPDRRLRNVISHLAWGGSLQAAYRHLDGD